MRKLLWIGDAGVSSGFARCTHGILDVLKEQWEVVVLGLNYRGDPHSYGYHIYPCTEDAFGLSRVSQLVGELKPDAVVVQNDPWNIPAYLERIGNVPTVGFIAVDGVNCPGTELAGLAHAIFWTEFGEAEAKKGGYRGTSGVVPLGVDLNEFFPESRHAARAKLGLPAKLQDVFIVGNVNRNQIRKRFDLTVSFFCEWISSRKIVDAFLYTHAGATSMLSCNISQLMKFYGRANRLIYSEPEVWQGEKTSQMRATYNAFDVQISTSQGEGWGLTTLEGMACGIPQIVPRFAALGEWPGEAVASVPISEIACTPNGINVIGGVVDRQSFINALDVLYQNDAERKEYGKRALAKAQEDRFRWANIGQAFAAQLEKGLSYKAVGGAA